MKRVGWIAAIALLGLVGFVALTLVLSVLIEVWWKLLVELLFHGPRITMFQAYMLSLIVSAYLSVRRWFESKERP